jgi:uncharacterized protein (DUF1501 family)
MDRRDFIQYSTLFSTASSVPVFLRSAAGATTEADENILVVVQLSGGNDGLNTLIQFRDDGYLANRQRLRIPDRQLIKLDDSIAFPPALNEFARLLESGRLAVVQGVGYPNSNRSHDVSMSVWHTARTDPETHRGLGWLGRSLDLLKLRPRVPASVATTSNELPAALRGRKAQAANIVTLDEFTAAADLPRPNIETFISRSYGSSLNEFMQRSTLDAYATIDEIASLTAATSAQDMALSRLRNPLASQLKTISTLIQADYGARVYYAEQPGYDTHSDQLQAHAQLLRTLSQSLSAFLDDLAATGNDQRVLLMCFSEFGRQVKENASAGTDHGTAGPMFLCGSCVQSGIHGRPLDLQQLEDNAPTHTTDFRDVYAGILSDWLQVEPRDALDNRAAVLSLFSL